MKPPSGGKKKTRGGPPRDGPVLRASVLSFRSPAESAGKGLRTAEKPCMMVLRREKRARFSRKTAQNAPNPLGRKGSEIWKGGVFCQDIPICSPLTHKRPRAGEWQKTGMRENPGVSNGSRRFCSLNVTSIKTRIVTRVPPPLMYSLTFPECHLH